MLIEGFNNETLYVSGHYNALGLFSVAVSEPEALKVSASYLGPNCDNPTGIALRILNATTDPQGINYLGLVGGENYDFKADNDG